MQAFVISLGALTLYGALHSFMAAIVFKQWVRKLLGDYRYEAVYRFLYNVVATITLVPVLAVIIIMPGETIWSVNPPLLYLMIIIQLVGVAGLLISLIQIDGSRFLGIRQLEAGLNGDPLPLPEEPLQTDGVYGLVRHPLYFFSLCVLWGMPVMTTGLLGLVIGTTLYFIVGSLLEEQKMAEAYGRAYEQYQENTPWMIPFIG